MKLFIVSNRVLNSVFKDNEITEWANIENDVEQKLVSLYDYSESSILSI